MKEYLYLPPAIFKPFAVVALILLIYMVLPGPSSITNFPPLPKSLKSTLSGDTWQVPNVAGYFSDNYRDFVIPYYRVHFKSQSALPFAPLRLNYPPEFAYTAIKDQTQSTYLEELFYPLRESLFINGLEPFTTDKLPRFEGATRFDPEPGTAYYTKVTLRYYPSPLWVRVATWAGIVVSFVLLYNLTRKVLKND